MSAPHRLLHTLVLSSAYLLEGCAVSHRVDTPDASAPAADASAPIDAAAPVDAAAPIDAAAPVDAAEPIDAATPVDAGDPRFCEPGWPTTKAQRTIEIEGTTYVCSWLDESDGGVDVSQCCILVPVP